MTGVLIRRGNLGIHIQREGNGKTQGEDEHLQANRERPSLMAFKRNQPCPHLDLRLPGCETVRK